MRFALLFQLLSISRRKMPVKFREAYLIMLLQCLSPDQRPPPKDITLWYSVLLLLLHSNNVNPPNGTAIQLARLRAELAHKTQEIQNIQQEYVKLQQTRRMQTTHDVNEAAVRTNPAIVVESKNDHDQADLLAVRLVWGRLKSRWEIAENKKAYRRELELAFARVCAPVLIKREPVHENQLPAPMATAEATQGRLSLPNNDSPARSQIQELRKRILDWLEFTDKHSRRRKRPGDHAHILSPAKRIKKSCPPHEQSEMPSSSSSSSAQASKRPLSPVANYQEVVAARHLN